LGGDGDIEILEELYRCNIVTVHSGLAKQRKTPEETAEILSMSRSQKWRDDLPTVRIALLAREFGGHYDPIFPY
jgi:hypothetical protein